MKWIQYIIYSLSTSILLQMAIIRKTYTFNNSFQLSADYNWLLWHNRIVQTERTKMGQKT